MNTTKQQLNDAQQKAVSAPQGPILVLAGAGTGKTRVLTNRILYLIEHCGAQPYNVLAITFTNKAAQEMKNRLFSWHCDAQYMTISTIHSFCAMVLRNEAGLLKRNSNFTIYADDDKHSVLKKVVTSIVEDANSALVDDVGNTISHLKNNATDIATIDKQKMDDILYGTQEDTPLSNSLSSCGKHIDQLGEEAFVKILTSYQESVTNNNAMDFDDLLYYVHRIFSTCPQILAKYQERYKHILIDEFQDTNKVQYEIFRMLAGRYNDIFVVGDDDQSIYSWRGADINNILNFEKDFPNAQVYKLEQNYRSTKRILDVANLVIASNSDRYQKVLFTDNETGVKVEQFSAYNEQDEAHYVVQNIQALVYNNGYSYKDCAILMRINALTRQFELQLNNAHIPYKVFGGFRFFERKEVKDVLAYLRLIENRYDNQAFVRCCNVPERRGIGDSTINKLLVLSADMGLPIVDIIQDSRNLEGVFNNGIIKKLSDFSAIIEDIRNYSHSHNLSQLVKYVIECLQFRQYYINNDDEDRAINIDELEQSVVDFQQSYGNDANLSTYLQNVALATDRDNVNDNGEYVMVATIHAVKGLEFKAVFIIGLEDGIFPISRSKNSYKDMQEERRLMYVAATRAKQRLYLTHAQSRYMYGRRSYSLASGYYSEIQRFLRPKPIVTESMLADDRVLDRLIAKGSDTLPITQDRPTVDMSKYRVGQKISSSVFGKGMILNINGSKVDIMFESMGKKCLDFNIAKIEIDNN